MFGRIKSRVCLLFIKWFILNFTYFQFMIHSNVQKVKFFSIPTKTDETMKKFWYGGCRTCHTRCVVPVYAVTSPSFNWGNFFVCYLYAVKILLKLQDFFLVKAFAFSQNVYGCLMPCFTTSLASPVFNLIKRVILPFGLQFFFPLLFQVIA